MSELVDVEGKPLAETVDRCPNCGAKEKDLASVSAFGGYHRLVCIKCGTEVRAWREGSSG